MYFMSYAFKYKVAGELGFGCCTVDAPPWEVVESWNQRYSDERSFVLMNWQEVTTPGLEIDMETHL